MTLSSMTGFARVDGQSGPYAWSWELKSLNAKGLELRFRIPPGWDAVETPVRAQAKALARGTVYANLTVRREGASPVARVNEPVLDAVLTTLAALARRIDAQPASMDGILGVKGVIEITEQMESPEEHRGAEAAIVTGFADALTGMTTMRRQEGAALDRILRERLDEIAALTKQAEAAPGRHADAVRQRLAEQVTALLDAASTLDPDRLHQEAVLLAAKADIREELDRLHTHVAQARRLLGEGGPVGRRLDFLAQEFNREVNTLCSKSNDVALTSIGLEMKNAVEQFREQVQNLE